MEAKTHHPLHVLLFAGHQTRPGHPVQTSFAVLLVMGVAIAAFGHGHRRPGIPMASSFAEPLGRTDVKPPLLGSPSYSTCSVKDASEDSKTTHIRSKAVRMTTRLQGTTASATTPDVTSNPTELFDSCGPSSPDHSLQCKIWPTDPERLGHH